MAVQSYSDVLRGKMPAFLLGPWGEKWVGVFGAVFDYLRDRAREGSKARFPTECDVSLLPTHGWERGIERVGGESDASYRARIHKARGTWRWAGTDIGVLRGLETLGWSLNSWLVDILDWPTQWGETNNVWLLSARDWGGTTPDGDSASPNWARFWVVLDWYGRHGLDAPTAQDRAAILSVIKKWKASRSVCRGVILVISSGSWGVVRGPHTLRDGSSVRGGATEVLP